MSNNINGYFIGKTSLTEKEVYFYQNRIADSTGNLTQFEREEIPFIAPLYKKKHYMKHATQVRDGIWKNNGNKYIFNFKNNIPQQKDYFPGDRIGNITLCIKFDSQRNGIFNQSQYWEWIEEIIFKDEHCDWEKKNQHQLFIDQYFHQHTAFYQSDDNILMIPLKFFFNWHDRIDQSIIGEIKSNFWELTIQVNSKIKKYISEMKLIMETYFIQGAHRKISEISMQRVNVFQKSTIYQVPSRGTKIYNFCVNELIYSFLGQKDYPLYINIYGTIIRNIFLFCYLDGKYLSLIKNINLLFDKIYNYHSPQIPIAYYEYFLPQNKFGKIKSGIYYLPFQYQNDIPEVDNSPGQLWQIVVTLDWDKYDMLSEDEKERLQIGIVAEESKIVRQINGLMDRAFDTQNIKFNTK